jgi:hypothetical protein
VAIVLLSAGTAENIDAEVCGRIYYELGNHSLLFCIFCAHDGRGRAGVSTSPFGRAGVSASESLFPMGVLAFP